MTRKAKRAPRATTIEVLNALQTTIPEGDWLARSHLGTIAIGGVPMVQADSTLITYFAYLHRNAAGWAAAVEELRRVEHIINRVVCGLDKLSTMEMVELIAQMQRVIVAAGAQPVE